MSKTYGLAIVQCIKIINPFHYKFVGLKVKANPLKNKESAKFGMNFPEICLTTALYISCHYFDQKQSFKTSRFIFEIIK